MTRQNNSTINTDTESERMLTPRETADRLRVSESWLAKARGRGDGPPFMKFNGVVRYGERTLGRHWACSLRQIAKWLNRPPAVIQARWQAVQMSIAQLHHARVGVTPKTLANHKSNVRAALCWLAKGQTFPQPRARLQPDWAQFQQGADKAMWLRVSSLARYCSAGAIGPSEVNDYLFQRYWDYRGQTTRLATNATAKRFA